MRIVFMGTPEIAEVCLTELLRDGHEVVAVYTREDKPQGRKQVVTPPPVKLRAAENRIPVYQPKTMRSPQAAEELKALAPDLVVVVAYGLLLPPEVLAIPARGCINLHVSLLPRYRGAAPIQWAVINGEKTTGVSVMQMDEGLDTGPVLAQREIEIPPEATAGEMFELSGAVGARLLSETVGAIAEGTVAATPQNGEEATLAPRLEKHMAEMDFGKTAASLHNLVRGCNPWPLAWFASGGKKVKVTKAALSGFCSASPGEILSTAPLTVACGEDALVLEHVRPEGSRAMTGEEWAMGRRFVVGGSIKG